MDEQFYSESLSQRKTVTQTLRAYLGTQYWDSFFTATFKRPIKHPGTAIVKTAAALSPDEANLARAFIAAEQHQSGAWHTHGLVCWKGDDPLRWNLEAAIAKYRLDKLGWSTLGSPRSVGGVTGYCSKYITKKVSEWMIYGKDWKPLDNNRSKYYSVTYKEDLWNSVPSALTADSIRLIALVSSQSQRKKGE